MSNLIYQLNHLQDINSARYNKFSGLATDCLGIGTILILITLLITFKPFTNKYLLKLEHARVVVALVLCILGIFTGGC